MASEKDIKVVSGWLTGGKYYCTKECAGNAIPFGFVPEGSKCAECGKEIGK